MNQKKRIFPQQVNVDLDWSFHLGQRYKERLEQSYSNIESFFQTASLQIISLYLRDYVDIGDKFAITLTPFQTQDETIEQPVFICGLNNIDYDYIDLTVVTCFARPAERFIHIMNDGTKVQRNYIKDKDGNQVQVVYVKPTETNLQGVGLENEALATVVRYTIVCTNSDEFLQSEKELFFTKEQYAGGSSVNFIDKYFNDILKYIFDMIYDRKEFNENNNKMYVRDGKNVILLSFDGFDKKRLTCYFTALGLYRYTEEIESKLIGMKGFGSSKWKMSAKKLRQNKVEQMKQNTGLELDVRGHIQNNNNDYNVETTEEMKPITLTESQLHNVIKESVKRILKEMNENVSGVKLIGDYWN